VASISSSTTSASSAAAIAASRMWRRSGPRPSCTPGVSTYAIWAGMASADPDDSPGGSTTVCTPRIRSRVVCGLADTATRWRSRIRLSSVDLPTLGNPTIAQNPARISSDMAHACSTTRRRCKKLVANGNRG
jgi:hypothetical protein